MGPDSIAFGVLVVAAALISVWCLEGRGAFSRALHGVKHNAPWVALLTVTVIGNWAFNRLRTAPSPLSLNQTNHWSDAFLQGLQGALPGSIAVPVFSFVYLAVFPSLLIALPLALLAEENERDIRAYCLALSLTVAGLFLCHLLIQSPRPGLFPSSGVSALMYNDPFWGNVSLDLGSRGNSFPSGHTAMVTAMLFALVGYPRVRLFLLAILATIVVGVLYLGLHWPLDVLVGLGVGAAAGSIAYRLSGRFTGAPKGTVPATSLPARRPDSRGPRI